MDDTTYFSSLVQTPNYKQKPEIQYDEPKNNPYFADNYYENGFATMALRGTDGIIVNDISKIFFSLKNIKRIQKEIKVQIKDRTNGKYNLDEDQDVNDLIIAMRAVFYEKSKNLPDKPIKQVKKLNKDLIEYIVPDMIVNIKQYYGFLRDIDKPIQPLDRQINVNNKGRKTLPSMLF